MALVAIVMGSDSDWRIMEQAKIVLDEFGVESEVEVLSAHRTPEKMLSWG
ncbi:MAG: 5-(carboxyamino)imidazole ribonucleotide mutase, partial [Actinobacteria bacterium]|nr:5-(carboxyamino)imidazole ribonucleotide mutase [Actinomycetota bacterium]